MPEPDDLTGRVRRLEDQVADLRNEVPAARMDAAAARALAAGADRDVSEVRAELRAHSTVLNALRETQLEQGRDLVSVKERLGSLAVSVDGRFGVVDERFGVVNQGINHIIGLLERDSGTD